jgi:hypothetical protein
MYGTVHIRERNRPWRCTSRSGTPRAIASVANLRRSECTPHASEARPAASARRTTASRIESAGQPSHPGPAAVALDAARGGAGDEVVRAQTGVANAATRCPRPAAGALELESHPSSPPLLSTSAGSCSVSSSRGPTVWLAAMALVAPAPVRSLLDRRRCTAMPYS